LAAWEPLEPKLARWAGRDVSSITKRDVVALLNDIVEGGAPVVANRTLSILKTAFRWCMKRDYLVASPCDHVDAAAPESPVERCLSDLEIAALWRAAARTGYPFGPMVQLLLLTGQRRDKVREAPRSEFDLAGQVWNLPGDRTKNGRDHLVPLSPAAVAILADLPKIRSAVRSTPGWLFAIGGQVPMSSPHRYKSQFDEIMLEELRKLGVEGAVAWRIHDLRHTLKTWMQHAQIPKDVRNAVQDHYDGGMDELYGHDSFEAEKREALECWAAHILDLI
jgi:integrase